MGIERKKTAVFCGASRGLGKVIARSFLETGWNVVVLDLSPHELSTDMHFYQCDVTHFESVEKVIKEVIRKFDSIDSLINCIRYRKKNSTELNVAEEWKK